MSLKKRNVARSTPTPATSSDTIDLCFSAEVKVTVHKDRVIYEKLGIFIEERLRYIYTFNYPYDVFYDDRNGNEHVMHSDKVDVVTKIREVLESDEGKDVGAFYFVADNKVSCGSVLVICLLKFATTTY